MLVALCRSLGGRPLLEPWLRCRACTRPIHIHIAPHKPAIAQLDVKEDLTLFQSTIQKSLPNGETVLKPETSHSSKSKMVKLTLARQSASSQPLRSKEKQRASQPLSESKAEKRRGGDARESKQPVELGANTPQSQRSPSLRKPGEGSPVRKLSTNSKQTGKKVKDVPHSASPPHQELKTKSSAKIESASKEDILATATRLESPYKWDEKVVRSLYSIPSEELFPSIIRKYSSISKSEKVFDWKADPMHFLQDGLKVNCKREVTVLNKGTKKLGSSYRVRLTINYCRDVCKAIGDGPSQVKSSRRYVLKPSGNCVKNGCIPPHHERF